MTFESVRPELAALADALWEAAATRRPIAQPSTSSHRTMTVDDAYAVQSLNIARRIAGGERPVGHKIGLTSLAMQQQLGIDTPDFGVITDAMVTANGGAVDPGLLLAPKVEAEFAFRIGVKVSTDPTPDEVRAAVTDVAVALELIDSRIADWRIGLVDTVADNASSAGIVVGPWRAATPEVIASLPSTVIDLIRDDTTLVSGSGAAVLGDPIVALRWLAVSIGRYGQAFRPGDVVLAGAVAAAVPLTGGNVWAAQADGFESAVVHSAAQD